MGKEFLRLVELAVASGALVIPGAEGIAHANPGSEASAPAPIVRSARLDRGGLTIEFSEALRPVSGVDPSKFRLTFAYYSKSRPGSYSYYYEYYGSTGALTVYSDVGRTGLKNRVEQPKPNRIHIPASSTLDLSSICEEISSAPATHSKTGLYLHYAGEGAAPVQSARGVPLGSIAAYWRDREDNTVTRGALTGRPIPVTVTCR